MTLEATFLQNGLSIDYTPSGADVAAGQVVVLGAVCLVAKTPIAQNALGSLAATGVYDVLKTAALAISAGEAVYWNDSTNRATKTTTDVYMGVAVADAGADDTTVRVHLRSLQEVVAEQLGLGDLSDVGAVSYTAGKVLVADGDSFEAVAVSGNVSLAANGAATVTGAAVGDTKEITFGTSKLARSGNNVIATLPTSDPGVAGALYVDTGTVKVSAGA